MFLPWTWASVTLLPWVEATTRVLPDVLGTGTAWSGISMTSLLPTIFVVMGGSSGLSAGVRGDAACGSENAARKQGDGQDKRLQALPQGWRQTAAAFVSP